MSSALRLNGWLTQQVLTAREHAEELIVQIVSIGQHDERRVFHRNLADDALGIEDHSQAFTASLCIPNHAHPPVAEPPSQKVPSLIATFRFRNARGLLEHSTQGPLHRHPDGVELVVPGHLLVELSTTVVLEGYEVAQEFEEVALVEHTLQEHLQMFCGQSLANGQRSPPPSCDQCFAAARPSCCAS